MGTRVLTAVGREVLEDDRTVAYFTLDGVTYMAAENPDDGYRSMMEELEVVTPVWCMVPVHPPLVVEVRARPDDYSCTVQSVYMLDEVTDHVVLEVGTDYTVDECYPSFLWSWTPEGYTPSWLCS